MMPADATQLLREVESELTAAREQLASSQRSILDLVAEIRDLVAHRTDSFVDLARHYLPNLTHQSIANAWSEVRGEIEDLLLRKNDRQRRFRKQLSTLESRKQTLRMELVEIAERAEHAKHVLSCRMGNYRKRLREDPEIQRCNQAIKKIDDQIELALAQLEFAQDEARNKLPDYEECALFDYLRDRQFGTPAYKARGLERRWDRWVARLIDYRDARKSYELLSEMPDRMKDLIKEKQSQYLELLEQLESARSAAEEEFGIEEQTRNFRDLCTESEAKQHEMDRVCRESEALCHRIAGLDDVNGHFYQEAIGVYRKFLSELEPAVLKVYASCTQSPVDDEICARLRNIQDEIDRAQEQSTGQKREIVAAERYIDALHDLTSRLRKHLQRTPGTALVYTDLDLPSVFGRMYRQELGVDEVWSKIRKSMVKPGPEAADPVSHGQICSPAESEISPLDACYSAASEPCGLTPAKYEADPRGIVLLAVPVPQAPERTHAGFTSLAACATVDEAYFLVSHLESHSIASFVRTEHGDTVYLGRDFESDEYHVVVDSRKLASAAKVLMDLQQKFTQTWECTDCRNRVDNGRTVCWSCGKVRTP